MGLGGVGSRAGLGLGLKFRVEGFVVLWSPGCASEERVQ